MGVGGTAAREISEKVASGRSPSMALGKFVKNHKKLSYGSIAAVGGLVAYNALMPNNSNGRLASRSNQQARTIRNMRSQYNSSGATQQLVGNSIGGMTGM